MLAQVGKITRWFKNIRERTPSDLPMPHVVSPELDLLVTTYCRARCSRILYYVSMTPCILLYMREICAGDEVLQRYDQITLVSAAMGLICSATPCPTKILIPPFTLSRLRYKTFDKLIMTLNILMAITSVVPSPSPFSLVLSRGNRSPAPTPGTECCSQFRRGILTRQLLCMSSKINFVFGRGFR